jgi:endonuclease/exonuclease/phosphatase family metal-dependent hydrolase
MGRLLSMALLFFPLFVLVLAGRASLDAAEGSSADSVLAMTFNLRYASSRPPNAWQDRLPVMKECIGQVSPDLIGTQEGLYQQLKDLSAGLPEYEWIGLGRDGGSHGEFMAVFYRKSRFEPLEYDHYWLSDTPNVIASSTWGNSNRRMVTWVRFLDRKAKQEFYFVNTHFDHQIQVAREKSAQLLKERVDAWTNGLPVVLVGDFNAVAGANPAYHTLVNREAFTDTWTTAREIRGEKVNTFHNFKGPTPGESRIDWVLTRGPVETVATQIITCSQNGQYPSDHFPVVAWLKWRAPQGEAEAGQKDR